MTEKSLAELSVKEIIAQIPGSIDLLNRYLFDTCCGEHLSLSEGAKVANAPLDAVLADLAQLQGGHGVRETLISLETFPSRS